MSDPVPLTKDPAPIEFREGFVRRELMRAAIWLGLIAAMAVTVLLVQPLLVIFAGLVFATLLDGGVRLLGRVLPIGRGWRLSIVVLAGTGFPLRTLYPYGVRGLQPWDPVVCNLV